MFAPNGANSARQRNEIQTLRRRQANPAATPSTSSNTASGGAPRPSCSRSVSAIRSNLARSDGSWASNGSRDIPAKPRTTPAISRHRIANTSVARRVDRAGRLSGNRNAASNSRATRIPLETVTLRM